MVRTFKLAQTPDAAIETLYPNASGCSNEWTPHGSANNWACMDEHIIDNDDTYVSCATALILQDAYNIDNHTANGTIQFVQLVGYFKSHLYDVHDDATLYLLVNTGTCTDIYKFTGTNIADDLTLAYQPYKETMYTNPLTGADWTWDDIDVLQVGMEGSSPTDVVTITLTLRPNGDGSWENLGTSDNSCVPYGLVDEAVPDKDDYIYSSGLLHHYDRFTTVESNGCCTSASCSTIYAISDATLFACSVDCKFDLSVDASTSTSVVDWYDIYSSGTYVFVIDAVTGIYSYSYAGASWSWLDHIRHGDSTRIRYRCIHGAGNHLFIAGHDAGGALDCIQSFTFDGAGNLTYVDDDTHGYGNTYWVHCFDGNVWLAAAQKIVLYSYNAAGNLTEEDTYATNSGIRSAMNDDGTYLYVLGTGDLICLSEAGGNITEECTASPGATFDDELLCKNGYIYCCGDGGVKVYTCDGNNFTLVGTMAGLDARVRTGHATHICSVNKNIFLNCKDEDDWNTTWLGSFRHLEKRDEFTFEDHTTETGAITRVKVIAYVYCENNTSAEFTIHLNDVNGGVEDSGSWTYAGDWAYFNKKWTNSLDGDAWTWADIDALKAGIEISEDGNHNNEIRVAQLYIEVEYSSVINPEIRGTQMYVRIGYQGNDTECELNMPTEMSSDHKRNVKMLNFWSGEREVYGLNRSGKSLVLKGEEFEQGNSICSYNGVCDRLTCVRNMAINGATVDVSDLPFCAFNDEYRIRSFGWRTISTKPIHVEWILELECANRR